MLPLEPCNLALEKIAWDAEQPQPAKKPPGKAAAATAASGPDAQMSAQCRRRSRRRRQTCRHGGSQRPITLRLVIGRPSLSGRRSGFRVGDAPLARRRAVARTAAELDAGHRSRVAGGERAGGRSGVSLAYRVGRPPSASLAHLARRHGQSSSATGLVAGVADVRFLAARRRSLGAVENSGPQRAAPAGDGAVGSGPATDFCALRRGPDSVVGRKIGQGRGGAGRAHAARADPRRRTRPSPQRARPSARRSTLATAADARRRPVLAGREHFAVDVGAAGGRSPCAAGLRADGRRTAFGAPHRRVAAISGFRTGCYDRTLAGAAARRPCRC